MKRRSRTFAAVLLKVWASAAKSCGVWSHQSAIAPSRKRWPRLRLSARHRTSPPYSYILYHPPCCTVYQCTDNYSPLNTSQSYIWSCFYSHHLRSSGYYILPLGAEARSQTLQKDRQRNGKKEELLTCRTPVLILVPGNSN